jgi:catechol 2,3-dioxygenase-like lactoylglutathione lyase family enzyme
MKAIEMISIPVSDQEQAKRFYVDLGFNVVFEGNTPDGGKWVQLGIPSDSTTITLVTGPHFGTAGSVKGLMIATEDIRSDIARLRKKGVKAADVQELPHGKISSFADPDGNQWVLREAPGFHR